VDKVKKLEEELQKEYEAAVIIECLWDAWDLAETPCLVDEEKVEECYNMPINFTNLTITYPLVPDPHPILDPDVPFGPEEPCTGEFIQEHYGHLDVDEETFEKMKEECKSC